MTRVRHEEARRYLAEGIATAILLAGGLTAVILVASPTGPVADLAVPAWLRRFVAGGLFGLTGTAATLSRWGRRSGAHLNPAVTLAFRLEGVVTTPQALGYLAAQLLGAVLGAGVARAWGPWGQGVEWGVTAPRAGLPAWGAAGLEAGVTFILIVLVLSLAARPTLRHLTPWAMGPLYAVLVALEGPLTGTSSNPARSFGPAVVTWTWTDGWVYWVGPLLGAVLGVLAARALSQHRVVAPSLVYRRLSDEAEFLAADVRGDARRLEERLRRNPR